MEASTHGRARKAQPHLDEEVSRAQPCPPGHALHIHRLEDSHLVVNDIVTDEGKWRELASCLLPQLGLADVLQASRSQATPLAITALLQTDFSRGLCAGLSSTLAPTPASGFPGPLFQLCSSTTTSDFIPQLLPPSLPA